MTTIVPYEDKTFLCPQEDKVRVIAIENRSYSVMPETKMVDALTVKQGSTISLLERMGGGLVLRMDGGYILLGRY